LSNSKKKKKKKLKAEVLGKRNTKDRALDIDGVDLRTAGKETVEGEQGMGICCSVGQQSGNRMWRRRVRPKCWKREIGGAGSEHWNLAVGTWGARIWKRWRASKRVNGGNVARLRAGQVVCAPTCCLQRSSRSCEDLV
jgi:hypothetical protein